MNILTNDINKIIFNYIDYSPKQLDKLLKLNDYKSNQYIKKLNDIKHSYTIHDYILKCIEYGFNGFHISTNDDYYYDITLKFVCTDIYTHKYSNNTLFIIPKIYPYNNPLQYSIYFSELLGIISMN